MVLTKAADLGHRRTSGPSWPEAAPPDWAPWPRPCQGHGEWRAGPVIDHQSALLRRQGLRRAVLCSATLASRSRPTGRRGPRGHGPGTTRTTERGCGHGRGPPRARPLLGDPSLGCTRRLPRHRLPRHAGAFQGRPEWGSGRPAQRGPMGPQQTSSSATAASSATTRTRPPPDMLHIDYGVTLLRGAAWPHTADEPPTSPPCTATSRTRASWPARGGAPVLRTGRPPGWRKARAHLARAAGWTRQENAHVLHDGLHRRGRQVLGAPRHRRHRPVVALLVALRGARRPPLRTGLGGSAGNASHAVKRLRKICGIESSPPRTTSSEITARVNDDGWETSSRTGCAWRLGPRTWCWSSRWAAETWTQHQPQPGGARRARRAGGGPVCGVVAARRVHGQGRRRVRHRPTIRAETVTPHAEAFQAVVWNLIVSHTRALRSAE